MYDSPAHARECPGEFKERDNSERPHWAFVPEEGGDPVTPLEVYRDGRRTSLARWQAWARDINKKIEKKLNSKTAWDYPVKGLLTCPVDNRGKTISALLKASEKVFNIQSLTRKMILFVSMDTFDY